MLKRLSLNGMLNPCISAHARLQLGTEVPMKYLITAWTIRPCVCLSFCVRTDVELPVAFSQTIHEILGTHLTK